MERIRSHFLFIYLPFYLLTIRTAVLGSAVFFTIRTVVQSRWYRSALMATRDNHHNAMGTGQAT